MVTKVTAAYTRRPSRRNGGGKDEGDSPMSSFEERITRGERRGALAGVSPLTPSSSWWALVTLLVLGLARLGARRGEIRRLRPADQELSGSHSAEGY
jgi:hypothetical protein